MLTKSTAFSSFSTNKLTDSFLFYKNVLGLEAELVNEKFLHLYLPGGHTQVVYDKQDHKPADYTALNFQVENIQEVVDHLLSKGIEFMQLKPPFQTDEKGISWDHEGSHIAWFKDPGGNIIALIEN